MDNVHMPKSCTILIGCLKLDGTKAKLEVPAMRRIQYTCMGRECVTKMPLPWCNNSSTHQVQSGHGMGEISAISQLKYIRCL